MILKSQTIRHITTARVRYADTDKMGYVYNGMYLTFFEVGRAELMRHFGLSYTEFEKLGFFLPLVEAHVNYKNPAYYDDLLEIEAILDYQTISSTMKFQYSIVTNGKLVAEGHTIHSFIKADTRKPVRPPVFFVDMLNNIK